MKLKVIDTTQKIINTPYWEYKELLYKEIGPAIVYFYDEGYLLPFDYEATLSEYSGYYGNGHCIYEKGVIGYTSAADIDFIVIDVDKLPVIYEQVLYEYSLLDICELRLGDLVDKETI